MSFTPRTQRQFDLQTYLIRFSREFDYAEPLLRLLRADQAEVYRAEPSQQGGRWNLFVFLPELLQEMFDVELEILCLATRYEHLEPRIANEIRDLVATNPRVDPNLVIVVSRDPGAEAMLRRRGDVAVLALSAEALAAGSYEGKNLRTLLAQVLIAVDHFDVTTPVSSAAAFFGRERDLAEVRSTLMRQQHVGVFGLRKAGKTSLLNRARALLVESGQPVARLDLNTVLDDPTLFRVRLIQAIALSMRSLEHAVPKLRTLNPAGELRTPLPDIRLVWLDDIGRLLDAIGQDLVLILDEIDTVVPAGADAPDRIADLLEPLAQLRGVIQDRSAEERPSLVLLTAGVDPSIFERPILLGRANPLYQFSTVKYLAPFSRDEMAGMVRALGKRSGLRFHSHQLIDRMYDEYGGHPLLTRQACSYVHTHRRSAEFPYRVSEEELAVALSIRGPNSPHDHLRDVLQSFKEWFPEESQVLRLALSQESDDRELLGLTLVDDPHSLVHAIGYGLLSPELTPRMQGLMGSIV